MTDIEWHLEERMIKDLKPNPKNPRRLTKDQERNLRLSIEKFGFSEKPLVNLDNMVIGGHQRLKVLKALKYASIQCWLPNIMLTPDQLDEYCIRLNKNHGEWDYDILANQYDVCDLVNYGFKEDELLGFAKLEEEATKPPKEDKNQMHLCPKCGHEFQ